MPAVSRRRLEPGNNSKHTQPAELSQSSRNKPSLPGFNVTSTATARDAAHPRTASRKTAALGTLAV